MAEKFDEEHPLEDNLIVLAHFLIINNHNADSPSWSYIKRDWLEWYRMWKEKETNDAEAPVCSSCGATDWECGGCALSLEESEYDRKNS